jgi:PAS domain S-box-containing protein
MAIDKESTESAAALRTDAEEKVAAHATANGSLNGQDVKRLYNELQIHQVELEMQNKALHLTKLDLEATRDSYFALYDLAPVGYLTLNKIGLIQRANLTAVTMLGVERDALTNKPIQKFIFSDDIDSYYLRSRSAIVAAEDFELELRLEKDDGSPFWVNLQASLQSDDELWIAFSDIGDRKQLEQSLRQANDTLEDHVSERTNELSIAVASLQREMESRKQAEEEKRILEQQFQQTQKLESLGVLAGGIAHDFNNILAIIMGYCSLTKMDYETAEKNIPEMEKAVERAAALCRQMLAYAGKAPFEKAQVDICTVVTEMSKMLQSTIAQNVVIKPVLAADVPCVIGDASQIRQVVMNLIINAAEAIGDAQGEVRVSLSKKVLNKDGTEKEYLGKIIPYGCYACLEITDTGSGMSDETYNRIFEPFYTTKFTGRGLGMSAVLGIINTHHGALQLSSELGKGTTFKIYLPVQISDCAGEEPLQQVASVPWKGSGTILLVEDEEQIKLVAKAMLEALGFTVIEASNGKEGLELFQKNAADISMVITDMGMPVMDGYQLFSELKSLRPDLPIIISSGFGDTVVTSRIASEDIAGSISKPYSFDRLREVLKRVMEGMQNKT